MRNLQNPLNAVLVFVFDDDNGGVLAAERSVSKLPLFSLPELNHLCSLAMNYSAGDASGSLIRPEEGV